MKQAKIFSDDFNRIIAATKSFVSHGSTKRAHEYIKLEFCAELQRVTAVAVDGYRLSVEHSVISDCEEDFSVFVKANTKLPKGEYATISTDGKESEIRCNGFIFGYEQPEDNFLDWNNAIPKEKPALKIGFNGNYLLSALQAARISSGRSFRNPIVMEIYDSLKPIIFRTNNDDIKMVLPIRIKE